jgi:hypothetical protein
MSSEGSHIKYIPLSCPTITYTNWEKLLGWVAILYLCDMAPDSTSESHQPVWFPIRRYSTQHERAATPLYRVSSNPRISSSTSGTRLVEQR